MRWIPVEETMPQHFVDVLILLERGRGTEQVRGYHSGTLSCWAVDIYLHHESNVTHWQPLPAMPDESADLLVTKQRRDDWIAYTADRPKRWESGRTEQEAVGKLKVAIEAENEAAEQRREDQAAYDREVLSGLTRDKPFV